MDVLRTLGYVIAACLVVSVVIAGAAAVVTVAAIGGLLLGTATVIGFVAFCIKDYCETKTDPEKQGEQ